MRPITQERTREIIADFEKAIREKKRPTAKPSEDVINFRNEKQLGFTRPILEVPIGLLRYRKDNGRIASDVIFFVRAMMAINGSFGEEQGGFSFSNSYTRGGMEARVSRWKSSADYLEKIASRLSRVRIENKDAVKLFREFSDRPATLVYLDPPYLGNRIRGYDFDQTSVDYHEQLLNAIVKAKCMVFISGYQSDIYDEYLSARRGWDKRVIDTTTRGHNGKNANRREIIWFNAQYQKASRTGRVPIRLSELERRFRKVNPKR